MNSWRLGGIVAGLVAVLSGGWFVIASWAAYLWDGAACSGAAADAGALPGSAALPDAGTASGLCTLPWGQTVLAVVLVLAGIWFARMLWAAGSGALR